MKNYEYFSGANVVVSIGNKELIECAGLSYVVQTSDQPVYGYASTQFDAVLNGREIVQGNFLVNYRESSYINNMLSNNNKGLMNNRFGIFFNINVRFGRRADNMNETIVNCRLLSRGTTIQISDQVILEEYSFIAQKIRYSK